MAVLRTCFSEDYFTLLYLLYFLFVHWYALFMIDELKLFKWLYSKYNCWYQTGAATLLSYIGLWLQQHNKPLSRSYFSFFFVFFQKILPKIADSLNVIINLRHERLPLSLMHISPMHWIPYQFNLGIPSLLLKLIIK